MSHGAGLYNIMHMRVGARHVVPKSGGFEEGEIFELARHFGNVHMFAAPTMVKRMTQIAKAHGGNGCTVIRTIVYAGGPMYLADIIEAVDHFGPIFVQVYGQGECPMGITGTFARRGVRSHPSQLERAVKVSGAVPNPRLRFKSGTKTEIFCPLAKSAKSWCVVIWSCQDIGKTRSQRKNTAQ
jgi:long-chain acyl-CoA synthetase